MSKETFKAPVTYLDEGDVLVYFGNTTGNLQYKLLHQRFGAKYSVITGMNGPNCYAIAAYFLGQDYQDQTSRKIVEKDFLRSQIQRLYVYALEHKDNRFLVCFHGADMLYTGYDKQLMGRLFSEKFIPDNVIFEEDFNKYIK
jgi:hypothetical protein